MMHPVRKTGLEGCSHHPNVNGRKKSEQPAFIYDGDCQRVPERLLDDSLALRTTTRLHLNEALSLFSVDSYLWLSDLEPFRFKCQKGTHYSAYTRSLPLEMPK